MSYEKQIFTDGQVLRAAHLNTIEDALVELFNILGDTGYPIRRTDEIFLPAANWSGEGHHYTQVVQIDGITANSQVDLTPSAEQLVIYYEKSLALVAENEDGVVTVHAIGQKPENDYSIQVTITEVNV